MSKKKSARRSYRTIREFEWLETRRLLTAVPSTASNWPNVSPTDTSPMAATPEVGSTTSYSLRELVEYYDDTYNSDSTPMTIVLAVDTTYTLTESASASSIEGGRNNNTNTYGALDVEPEHTTEPLIIEGGTGAILTCDDVEGTSIPLDRLIHVISGSLQLEAITLEGGEARDNSSGQYSNAVGGGVLVSPGGTLSLTNCTVQSNKAVASTDGIAGQATGISAAGGGVYGSAGSAINIVGSTRFVNNQVFAGNGGASGGTGEMGGDAFGGGLALAVPNCDPSPVVTPIPTALTFTGEAGSQASFTSNRLNVTTSGLDTGGTGGAGSGIGGDGGSAYGGGMYVGSGALANYPSTLALDGGSSATPVSFSDNQIAGGAGYDLNKTGTPGAGGLAFGAGAYIEPEYVTVTSGPSSGGILAFAGNTGTSYSGNTPATTTSGLAFPTVNTSGAWDLANAITALNPLAATGMMFTLTLPEGSYTGGISITDTGTGSLTLVGVNESSTVITGQTGFSVFSLTTGADVVFQNLTIKDGSGTNGGGICASGASVRLSNVSVTDNTTTGSGGGIYQSGGNLNLIDSIISNNQSGDFGGGLEASNAAIVLSTVSVTDNQATASGGGIYQSGGTLNLVKSIVKDDSSDASGGGLWLSGCGFTMSAGQLSGDTASMDGGALYDSGTSEAATLSSVTISSNTAETGDGGGIFVNGSSTIAVSGGTISNNKAADGAGIYASTSNGGDPTITLAKVTISGNTASASGGGIYATSIAKLAVSSATVESNSASGSSGSGGGIYQSGGTLSIKSTPIKNNTASQGGGAYFANGSGTLIATSVKDNSATESGGGLATSKETLEMTSANVSSNTIEATGSANGAGLYLSNGGTLTTSGFKVTNNTITAKSTGETIEGAGIYASGTTITFGGSSTSISGNQLIGDSTGTGYGAGVCLTSGAGVEINSPTSFTNNTITFANPSATAYSDTGLGGAIAFFSDATYSDPNNDTITLSGNSAPTGGDQYAFVVSNTNYSNAGLSNQSGVSGIAYFTNGTGTLDYAITYCDTYMTDTPDVTSMAIILTGTYSTYGYSFTPDVPANDTLTLIGTAGSQSVLEATGTSNIIVDGSGTLVLQNIEITGGSTTGVGGGIDQESGTTVLNDVLITDNIAGPTGAGSPNYNPDYDYGTTNGPDGGNGADGYGGGVDLAGGTLEFNSGTAVTSNTVRAQNGGDGGGGDVNYSDAGNGGNGGNGGSAYGGGIYQNGGTLIINDLSASPVTDNTASPGQGGAGGTHGVEIGEYGELSYGSSGHTGSSGTGYPNYVNAGGHTILAVTNVADLTEPQIAGSSGGMYSSAGGTLSPDKAFAGTSSSNGVAGISLDLFSANGTFIAQSTTNDAGQYFFDSSWSGLGYVQVSDPPIFQLVALGTPVDGTHNSGIDPTTDRSGLITFLDGVPINQGLDIGLKAIRTSFVMASNAVALRDNSTHDALWKERLMPASYKGGFTMTRFDVNGDKTPDYVLVTKKGPTILFIVNGRTGAVTRIRGPVDPAFRHPFRIQSGNFASGGGKQLLIHESSAKTGAVMLVDLATDRLVWSRRLSLPGTLRYTSVDAREAGRAGLSDIWIQSAQFPKSQLVLNGQTGKIAPKPTVQSGPSISAQDLGGFDYLT